MRLAGTCVLVGMGMAGCNTPQSSPPEVPIIVAPVPPASASAVLPAPPSARDDGASDRLAFDGVKLGSPIGALLARASYAHPCDVDPIDHGAASLYFWAAGPCRDAPAFPSETSVVILTTRTPGTAPASETITLVAWAGGTYFDDRTQLGVRIGDNAERLKQVLGNPSLTSASVVMKNGTTNKSTAFSWNSGAQGVHAYLVEDKATVLAIGDLGAKVDFEAFDKSASERAETLERLHGNHQRYRTKSPRP